MQESKLLFLAEVLKHFPTVGIFRKEPGRHFDMEIKAL